MIGSVPSKDISIRLHFPQIQFEKLPFSLNFEFRKVPISLIFLVRTGRSRCDIYWVVLGFGDFFKSESTSESVCWFCFELGENIMIDNLRFWKFEKSSQSWGFFMKNRKFWNFPKFLPKKCTRGTWKIFWKFEKSECFFMINRKFWNFLKFLPKKCARTLKNERFWKFDKSFGSASLRRSPFI